MSERPGEPLLVNTGDVDHPTPISRTILNGYAPDGELYAYSDLPEITYEELVELRDADYPTIFYAISKKLLGSAVPDEVLRQTAQGAYASENFDFDEDGSLRFTALPSGIQVVGLSDGPTGAFKDMAMQPFARWMSYLQRQEGSPLTIMLATSGDTGPAALNAFAGLPNTEIINMLPRKGVSLFQLAQMAELAEEDGVHVLEIDGNFSEINDMHLAADEVFKLSTVNSVNIARLVAQVPYYVASYLKAIRLEDRKIGDPVDVSVPSGNFGNALSAIMARKMGVPIRNIIVATNENNTLDVLFRDWAFRLADFQHTDSSAQDVRMPSNVWRYFGMLYNNDPTKVTQVYQTLQNMGLVAINELGVEDETVRQNVYSATIDAPTRARTIRKTYEKSKDPNRIILDPHTANGVAAIYQLGLQDRDVPMLSMETAKPFKFNEVMFKILGILPPRPERFVGLEEKFGNRKLISIDDQSALMTYLFEHTLAWPKHQKALGS